MMGLIIPSTNAPLRNDLLPPVTVVHVPTQGAVGEEDGGGSPTRGTYLVIIFFCRIITPQNHITPTKRQ